MSFRKLFCGKDVLPPGYDGYDSRYNCLRKGVGVGLYLSKNRKDSGASVFYKQIPWWVILILVILIIIVILLIIVLIFFKKQ